MSGVGNGNVAAAVRVPPKRHPIMYQPLVKNTPTPVSVPLPATLPQFTMALPTISDLVTRATDSRKSSVIVTPQPPPSISQLAARVTPTSDTVTLGSPSSQSPLDLTTSLLQTAMPKLDMFSAMLATPPSTPLQPSSVASPSTSATIANFPFLPQLNPAVLQAFFPTLSPASSSASSPKASDAAVKAPTPSTSSDNDKVASASPTCPLQMLAKAAEEKQREMDDEDADIICLGEHKTQSGEPTDQKPAAPILYDALSSALMNIASSTNTVISDIFQADNPNVNPRDRVERLISTFSMLARSKRSDKKFLLHIFQELYPDLSGNRELMDEIAANVKRFIPELSSEFALIEIDIPTFSTLVKARRNLFRQAAGPFYEKNPKDFELVIYISALFLSKVAQLPVTSPDVFDKTGFVYPQLSITEVLNFLNLILQCYMTVDKFADKKKADKTRKRRAANAASPSQPQPKKMLAEAVSPVTTPSVLPFVAPFVPPVPAFSPFVPPATLPFTQQFLRELFSTAAAFAAAAGLNQPSTSAGPSSSNRRGSTKTSSKASRGCPLPAHRTDICSCPKEAIRPIIVPAQAPCDPVPVRADVKEVREHLIKNIVITPRERAVMEMYLDPKSLRGGSDCGQLAMKLSLSTGVMIDNCVKYIWEHTQPPLVPK